MSQLHDILGHETLTGIVQDPRAGTPASPVPAGYFAQGRAQPNDHISWWKVKGNRKHAIIAERGSESQRRKLKGLQRMSATALFSHEHNNHPADVLDWLNSDSPQTRALGQQYVAQAARDQRSLQDQLRKDAVQCAVLTGYIRYSIGIGLHAPTGSDGQQIDYGIPAGNRGQLDILGGGAIIDASWAVSTTDIPAQMREILRQTAKKSGVVPTTAVYGKNIVSYLMTNNFVSKLMGTNKENALAAMLAQGMIPDGLMGIQNWVDGSMAWFVEEDGTEDGNIVDLVGDDEIKFLPTPSPEIYELIPGTYRIPTTLGEVYNAASGALASFAPVVGRFSYAKVTDDPSGIKHIYGDTFMPVIKLPNAFFYATVKP